MQLTHRPTDPTERIKRMKNRWRHCLRSMIVCLGLVSGSFAQSTQQSSPIRVDSETISGLGARNIGSASMSGRIAALDAVQEGSRLTIFIGSASGGVWKSVNSGATF